MTPTPANVADTLCATPYIAELELDADARGSDKLNDFVEAVVAGCQSAGVTLKGVRVDPFVGAKAFPRDAEFPNAWRVAGTVIVLDPRLTDRIVIVRG